MIDLNELAMFVHVVRAGSFSEAARRLGMPANTLSRRIDQLEGALGTRLLHRTTRKLSLSAEGQAMFERYAPALDQLLSSWRRNCSHRTSRVSSSSRSMSNTSPIRLRRYLQVFACT